MLKRHLAFVPIALALALVGAVTPAAAHTGIEGTVPADGETLTTLPDRFSVTASEELNDITGTGDGFALHIIDPSGQRIDTGEVLIEGHVASTPAVVDEPGKYVFAYQVVGEDGHPVTGEIAFVWAPDGAAVDDPGTNAPGEQAVTPGWSMPWWGLAGIVLAVIVVVGVIVLLVIATRRRRA